MVIWLTGLSSSGKTTLAEALSRRLLAEGDALELLDGDVVRRQLCQDLDFSKAGRDENIRRIGFVAGALSKHGVTVIVSAISPYRSVRDEVRSRIPGFVEVYVNAPLAICEHRDVKGLYRKARAGEIRNFTGVDDPYEPPLHPQVECRTDLESIEESAEKVLQFIAGRWVRPA